MRADYLTCLNGYGEHKSSRIVDTGFADEWLMHEQYAANMARVEKTYPSCVRYIDD